MNADQLAGARIVLVGALIASIALVCSSGWGNPRADLWLFHVDYHFEAFYSDEREWWYFTVWTKYVLAPSVALVGYGVGRYFSLIPPLWRAKAESPKQIETRN